ncbi:hypothetical protein [Kocuria sp. cx-455]|uniref:hypothetical protein n=1 Tax=Kocuria sp. cx-455 TaxID=2771377 RepID=UPI003D75D820
MSSQLRIGPGDPVEKEATTGLSIDRLRTIIQDSHLNFLIGAGTSAPFFEPLGDVEKALTALRAADEETRLARASVQGYFFQKVLAPNARLLNARSDSGAQTLIKTYARFMAVLNRILLRRRSTLLGKQVNLFTTNIDMASEVALELLEIDTNDGFSGKIRPRLDLGEYSTLRYRQGGRFEYQSEIPTVNLFKIHGSAAWRGEGDDIYFDHQLKLVQAVQTTYEAAKPSLIRITRPAQIDAVRLKKRAVGKVRNDEVKNFVKAYSRLQIVNPEKTKFASTVLNKTYYELLRRFANELEKENSALFVHGFSFRDEHLLDLVTRAAATNPTLQVIVFCYDRDSYEEIKQLFPMERVKNGNILFVRPAEPEKDEDERKLSLGTVVEDFLEQVLVEKAPSPEHIIELKLDSAVGDSTNV